MNDTTFKIIAFLLLGIERFLYGYWYIYPNRFMAAVRQGVFGTSIQEEPLHWKSAMTLGKYVKVFQFSVILYDLLMQCDTITNPLQCNSDQICTVVLGTVLLVAGQGLNVAVFQALGPMGVYYGYEFGYKVERVSGFPYNIGISDPQYWGVVMTIWGIYLVVSASSYTVPVVESFWYVVSMKVLENPRGRKMAKAWIGPDIVTREKTS